MANFQLMQLMQVAPSCGQFFNSCKWRHLVAKFGTNASGATISWKDNSSSDAIPWVRCASGNVFIGPRCLWGPIYGFESLKQTEPPFADLTDVTPADEDTNSILADNAKREIQSNEAMQVM